MNANLGKVVKKELTTKGQGNWVESIDDENCDYDRFVFINCRKIKPKEISIWTNPKSNDWQIGFFDADDEVYFDEIMIGNNANLSNTVRNCWWNRKEGEQRREGYYSIIKLAKKLIIYEKHANELLDYAEGKYQVGEHWQIHELDRNIELRIEDRIEQTTVERFQKYFDNIWCNQITTDLKAENNIIYDCYQCNFLNCKDIAPQKLVISAIVGDIYFYGAANKVHIPEIVMEEKADLNSIIQNNYGSDRHEKYYSLLPYVQTLVIRNNPKVLCDLADYINGRYKIDDGWVLHQLNKNMKIMIEKPGVAFGAVKKMLGYFVDVLVDNHKPEKYLATQYSYYIPFQEHFNKYNLETYQIINLIPSSQDLKLKSGINIRDSNRQINKLQIEQKLGPQQFVCFHDTDKPVVIDKIVIWNGGDLRCVLQNAYYNGTNSGFFSLLQTAKELEICNNHDGDNQVLADLADYVEGKYTLNANWKYEELDKNMKININTSQCHLSLSIARRLTKYFNNVPIGCIQTPLEAENVIDQRCEDKCIFIDSRKVNPQKLVINAKLMGRGNLIAFKQANGIVYVPEIIVDEQGCFAAIVRNHWQNNKEGDEKKFEYYSLVQHAETLTIRNNPEALVDFANYVVGKYRIENSDWKLQQLRRDIRIVIEKSGIDFNAIKKISDYFADVMVNNQRGKDYVRKYIKEFQENFSKCGLETNRVENFILANYYLKLENHKLNVLRSNREICQIAVKQKIVSQQFICFHDTNKPVTIDKIFIDDSGDLRCVLQNAYYNGIDTGFFSLLKTVKELCIYSNQIEDNQVLVDLADYIEGKYALNANWKQEQLDRNIKIRVDRCGYNLFLNVRKRFGNYFRNVLIDYIQAPLKTENVIDQDCEDTYIFGNCRDANPHKLVVNAKLAGIRDLIKFNNTDGEICIPEITIGEHGSFNAIIRNQWWNDKNYIEEKQGYYSLVSHVETLIIQNNPGALCDLDRYVSMCRKIQNDDQKDQKLNKNMVVRINGVNGSNEQINKLKEYFGYIFVDNRKVLGNNLQQLLIHINSKNNDIRQRQVYNKQKQQNIGNSVTNIQGVKRRIERARARLGRHRARFQEYLTLAE